MLEILAIAIGLGMDAMSVSMAIGVRWHGPGQKFRLSWHMGLFQFLMPIAGWALGRTLAELLARFGGMVAGALVFGVGVKMLYEAVRRRPGAMAEGTEHLIEKELHLKGKDPTRGWSLLILSVATSIDALVVGFSLGVKGRGIWLASLVIGIVAAGMVLVGMAIGRRAGKRFGRYAELAGAAVLMALGAVFALL